MNKATTISRPDEYRGTLSYTSTIRTLTVGSWETALLNDGHDAGYTAEELAWMLPTLYDGTGEQAPSLAKVRRAVAKIAKRDEFTMTGNRLRFLPLSERSA